jgi:aryl-alcohol dehydrogenase-like predicted oxidoreductase
VNEIAAAKHVTPSQLALAWLLAQGKDIVPIPGTKHRKYLEENVAATRIKLTREELERLDAEGGGRRPALPRHEHGQPLNGAANPIRVPCPLL